MCEYLSVLAKVRARVLDVLKSVYLSLMKLLQYIVILNTEGVRSMASLQFVIWGLYRSSLGE